MKNIILILSLLVSLNIQSQESYTTAEGQVHLLGDIDLNHLEKEPYAEWFLKNPEQSYKLLDPSLLKEVNVRIFIGTWCGDTQKLLPEFVSLWKKN